jgi:hypothetical protein
LPWRCRSGARRGVVAVICIQPPHSPPRDDQDTNESPRNTQNLDVDLRVSGHPAQSASEYAVTFNSVEATSCRGRSGECASAASGAELLGHAYGDKPIGRRTRDPGGSLSSIAVPRLDYGKTWHQ